MPPSTATLRQFKASSVNFIGGTTWQQEMLINGRARHAWAFTLFGITVAAATVHLWNALFVLFLFLIGAGAWLIDAKPDRARPEARIGAPGMTFRPARLF